METLDFLHKAGVGIALSGFLVAVVFLFLSGTVIDQLPSKRSVAFVVAMVLVILGFVVATVGTIGG